MTSSSYLTPPRCLRTTWSAPIFSLITSAVAPPPATLFTKPQFCPSRFKKKFPATYDLMSAAMTPPRCSDACRSSAQLQFHPFAVELGARQLARVLRRFRIDGAEAEDPQVEERDARQRLLVRAQQREFSALLLVLAAVALHHEVVEPRQPGFDAHFVEGDAEVGEGERRRFERRLPEHPGVVPRDRLPDGE